MSLKNAPKWMRQDNDDLENMDFVGLLIGFVAISSWLVILYAIMPGGV